MKRYFIWILTVYLLLLLIPMPLLITKTDKDREDTSSSASSVPSETTTSEVSESSTDTVSDNNTNSSESGSAADNIFHVLITDTGKVEDLSVRDFVIGSVSVEMYPSYHSEALKAQAAASYTYYTYQKNKQKSNPDSSLNGADFADKQSGLPVYYTDDKLKERWGSNYDTYYKKISEAVDSVLGKAILYNGEPIDAVYHAISSGTTEDSAVVWGNSYAYLKPVASPGDKLSPSYQSTVSVTSDELSSKLKTANADLTLKGEPSAWLGDIQTSSSGTVTQIHIGEYTFTGRQVREAVGLKSACFTVKYENGNFIFTVCGSGHDVGMSQYGADYLARQGSSWEDILKYYYTGVSISDYTG